MSADRFGSNGLKFVDRRPVTCHKCGMEAVEPENRKAASRFWNKHYASGECDPLRVALRRPRLRVCV